MAGEIKAEKICRIVDLQNEVFPDESWFVEGILPSGLTILVGRPKTGKSWFILQMCIAISSGKPFMDKFKTEKCSVLYLSMEDWGGSLQKRVNSYGSEIADDFYYMTNWKRFNGKEKGFEILQATIEENGISLVFIDTWQQVRPDGSNRNMYEFDVRDLKRLQSYARPNNIGLVLCHHERKGTKDGDNSISSSALGSTGIGGAADTLIKLNREEFAYNGMLSVTGRVGEGRQCLLFFENGVWGYEGDGRLAGLTAKQKQVYESFNGDGKTHGQVCVSSSVSGSTVTNSLRELLTRRLLREEDGIYYRIG